MRLDKVLLYLCFYQFVELPKTENNPTLLLNVNTKIHAHILIVDDEIMLLDIEKEMLKKLGCTVLTAHNGVEALDLYKRNKTDLDAVILDLKMPEMGGKEAYYKMKDFNPDIAAILTTGYGLESEVQDLIKDEKLCFFTEAF